jgi:anti-sigma B factor antagonist
MEILMTGVPPSDDLRPSQVLRVHRRADDAGIVVHVAGELDLLTAPDLDDELTKARAEAKPPRLLVVDLTDLTFMGSVGLSILITHDRLCHEADMELRVVAGNRTIARTITQTGLDDTLTVYTTLAEALAPTS